MEFAGLGHHHNNNNNNNNNHNTTNNHHKHQKEISDHVHSDTGTSFADMKRKIGNHRRSLKDKMRKFYSRGDRLKINNKDVEKDGFLSQTEKSRSSSPSQQNSRPKKDKNIFGSLPRIRKSRTSACLDDKTTTTTKPSSCENSLMSDKHDLPKKGNSEFHISQCHHHDFETAVRNSLKCEKTTDL